MKAGVRIGTSGFTYDHWREVFYPEDVPKKRWLEYYCLRFDTVEINTTYYRMPRENVCESWYHRTPNHFSFVLKLNRFITHRKRLLDCAELLESFLEAAKHLRGKLGALLVQLPPRWGADPGRLDDFLKLCPKRFRWAVEFRDPSWLCEEVFAVLRKHNSALVIHDLIDNHVREVTGDFVYLRFHGPQRRYAGCYPSQSLRAAGKSIKGYLGADLDVFAYFNNDIEGHAVANATDLKRYVLED